jgi:hypothetical protein
VAADHSHRLGMGQLPQVGSDCHRVLHLMHELRLLRWFPAMVALGVLPRYYRRMLLYPRGVLRQMSSL